MTSDSEQEALAMRRFMIINAVRFSGVLMTLLGILIANGIWDLPPEIGYVVAVLGVAETFFVPTMLSRRWSTKNKS